MFADIQQLERFLNGGEIMEEEGEMKTYRKEGLDHDFELVIHRGEVQGYVDFKKGDESLFTLRGGKREGINYFKKEEEFLAEDFTEGWEIEESTK